MNAMRAAMTLLGLVILAASATACGGDALSSVGPSGNEAEVRRLMDRQFDLMRDQNWRELYHTYSPAFQENCPYDQFLDAAQTLTDYDLNALDKDELKIRMDGDIAYTTYIVTYEGADMEAVTEDDPDLYVRIDGKWYDEVDSHTECY